MKPAITSNNTFGYNNFEFRIYTTENNTPYTIIVDNITIGNGTIEYFKKYVYWSSEQSYIGNLTVIIGNEKYIYYNIFVFSSSIYNDTKEEEIKYGVKFTDDEFTLYMNQVRLKLFMADIVGLVVAMIMSTNIIREIKKSIIKEV